MGLNAEIPYIPTEAHSCVQACTWSPGSHWCCDVSDHPQQAAVVSQDKEENSEEDVYEYDFPRPVVPPAPTRRTLSEISSPSAAFSTLSIDSVVEGTCFSKACCLHHQTQADSKQA